VTHTDDMASSPSVNVRPLVVFIVFAVLGPPMGAFILIGGLLMIGINASQLPQMPSAFEFAKGMALVTPFSFMLGGVQAAFVALVAAFVNAFRPSGLLPFWPVLIASFLAGAGFVVVIAAYQSNGGLFLLFVGLHIAAGFGCWLIANAVLWRFRRRPTSTGSNP
jgi:hypothetical protein